MSVNKSSLSSLSRRSFGLPLLKLLTEETSINFGKLMEKLQISKKGLYITLKDLAEDDLIVKERRGKKTFVKITKKGESALVQYLQSTEESHGLIEEIVNQTLIQLKEEGIISPEWSEDDHKDFVAKLKATVLHERSISDHQD